MVQVQIELETNTKEFRTNKLFVKYLKAIPIQGRGC